jgi:hypothetical protein
MMVVLVAPPFDLVDHAPRHKIRPAMNKEESPFRYAIFLVDNKSIYDDFTTIDIYVIDDTTYEENRPSLYIKGKK